MKRKLSFLPLFIISIAVAAIPVLTSGSGLLLQTEVLDENLLHMMKYQSEDSKMLFLYVLKERSLVIPALFLLSTTYLGAIAAYGAIIWYGTGIGMVLGIAMLRYGFRGILLVLVAGIPQYLLYIPAFIITLRLCLEQRQPSKKFFEQLFILELVVIIGCALESYVNLMLIEKFINLFIVS